MKIDRLRIMLGLGAVVWLAGYAAYPLLESTEGRYASIAWSMAHGSSWIEPLLNTQPVFSKPPLAYWAGATALSLFPDTEWVVRLPALFSFLVCAWLTMRLAGSAGLDHRRSLWAGGLCLLSPLAFIQGHMTTGDLFLWTGTLLVFNGLFDDENRPLMRRILIGFGLALGFMAKGHMILFWVVLPTTLWALSRGGEAGRLKRLIDPVSLSIFAVLSLPWFAIVLHRHPDLLAYWLGSETSDRFLTTSHGRAEPWWYFLPLVPLLILPWMVEFIKGLGRLPDRKTTGRLWLFWIVVPLLIFSFSGSKRPNYLLPMVTPLVLIVACGLPSRVGRRLRVSTTVWAIILLAGPFIYGAGGFGSSTRYLVREAERLDQPLAAYHVEPSSLVFYARHPVPVFGMQRSATPGATPHADRQVGGPGDHLAAGGLLLVKEVNIAHLQKTLGREVKIVAVRGRYRLVTDRVSGNGSVEK